jgi:hypothetical protein
MARQTEDTLTLECVLTNDEKLAYAKEMAEEHSKQHEAEGALKAMSKQMKATIEQHMSRIGVISHKLNTGREYRKVKCKVAYDWDTCRKQWYREDTGELARDNPIPTEEYQEHLKLEAESRAIDEEVEAAAESEYPEDGTETDATEADGENWPENWPDDEEEPEK